MDINHLFSYINNKETYTKNSVELFKSTLEEAPYFHAAHILLLKSLYINEISNYNSQLKISGTYISDKTILFKFINEEIIASTETKEEKIVKEEKTVLVEQKELTPEEKIKALKEKNKNKRKKPFDYTKTNEDENKNKILNTNSNEVNAKKRHNGIISDFFQSKEPLKKAKPEKNKIEPINKEINKKNIQDSGVITAKQLFEANKLRKEKKVLITKEDKPETIKKLTKTNELKTEIKNQPIIKKEIIKTEIIKTEISNKPVVKKTETIKKAESVNTKLETEKQKIEKTPVKKNTQTDAMSNIFSKIKAIKKEMKIDSHESNNNTIDVNKNQKENNKIVSNKSLKLNKNTIKNTTENIKKIDDDVFNNEQEPIDPFKQRNNSANNYDTKKETDKKEIVQNKTQEENKITKEIPEKKQEPQIKEEEVTAKDLFNRHIKNKSIETEKKKESKGISSYVDNYISKETKKEGKTIEKEKKKEAPIINKENIDIQKQTNKSEDNKNQKTTNAADLLLKRIALKKQKIQEKEQEQERINKIKTNKEEHSNKKYQEPIKEEKEFEIDEEKRKSILQIKQKNNIGTEKKDTKAKVSNNLIDNFINKSDSLERLGTKESVLKGDISINSTKENDEIITESIADLYVQQKHFKKAISAYEKLILKFPEKKTYFAIQIKKVESFIK